MTPQGRTGKYAIWRACERFHILPPDVEGKSWDGLNTWAQASLIGYQDVRGHEEFEILKAQVGAR